MLKHTEQAKYYHHDGGLVFFLSGINRPFAYLSASTALVDLCRPAARNPPGILNSPWLHDPAILEGK